MKKRTSKLVLNDLFMVSFISMKAAGAIDWSWWLVLIPVYLALVVVLVQASFDEVPW